MIAVKAHYLMLTHHVRLGLGLHAAYVAGSAAHQQLLAAAVPLLAAWLDAA
jgi:hypothetical protein